MNSIDEIRRSDSWWSGVNTEADEALNLARDAMQAKDPGRCFAHLRTAMARYGWEFHSDSKARWLWDKWDEISEKLRDPTSAGNAKTAVAIEKLYHETYRAVHFDRDRKRRRNCPPRDPAVRIEPVVPVGGGPIVRA
ncbi:MAG: hypothetical protein M3N97_00960 [Pseudomonadota bacterium]|nr:hypothetical protein [Pseudomonadota bacterium]